VSSDRDGEDGGDWGPSWADDSYYEEHGRFLNRVKDGALSTELLMNYEPMQRRGGSNEKRI
jgi:hypothetical protein